MKENPSIQFRKMFKPAIVLLAIGLLIFLSAYRVAAQDASLGKGSGIASNHVIRLSADGSIFPILSSDDCGLITFSPPVFSKTTSAGKPVASITVKNSTSSDIFLSAFSFDWTLYKNLKPNQILRGWEMGNHTVSFYTSQASYFWASNVGPIIPANKTSTLRFYFSDVDSQWKRVDPKVFSLSAEFNQSCVISLPTVSPTSVPLTITATGTATGTPTVTPTEMQVETPTSTDTATPDGFPTTDVTPNPLPSKTPTTTPTPTPTDFDIG